MIYQRYKLLFQETFKNPEDVISQSFNQEFTKIVLIADGVLSELLVKACYEPSGRFTYTSIFVDITFSFLYFKVYFLQSRLPYLIGFDFSLLNLVY